MKKCLCILLCVLLALPLTGLAKATDASILELLNRQIEANTSYRVQLSGSVSGSAPFFADPDTWESLRLLLPEVSLNATFVRSKAADTLGNTQTRLMLYRANQKLSTLTVTGQGSRSYLSGDVLGDQVLSIPRDANDLSMLLFPSEEGAWPSLSRALYAVVSADSDWQSQFDTALEPYYAQLSAWLQQSTQMTLERGADGTMRTVSTAVFTMRQAAQEAEELLRTLYQDETLLGLLRQRFSAEEAAAYLEPGMLPVFVSALEQMASEQQLTLTRAFTAEGALIRETLELPFESGAALSHFRLEKEDGTQTVEATLASGNTLRFSLRAQGTGVYAGEFSLSSGESVALAGTYLFTAVLGEEQYNEANAGRERSQQHTFSLLVQPAQGQAFPAQLLQADITLAAGASTENAVWVDVNLSYSQPGTDTALSLKYHSRTASPLALADVNTNAAVALDGLSQQELTDYVSAHSEALLGNLLAILGQIQPVTPVPATEAPTQAPTDVPTVAPTETPTEAPTQAPAESPAEAPAENPAAQ